MQTRNSKLQLSESNGHRIAIVSNSLFIIGTSIMLAAVIYMIVNLNKADSIITMWLPSIVVGISLTFGGLILRLITKKPERKIHNFTRVRPIVR